MKSFDKSELEQINVLEEDLQELLDKSEKILGYKPDDLNKTVEDLLTLNTEESNQLAEDIIDIEEEIIVTEEYLNNDEIRDNPFDALCDNDDEF